nr:translation initiation factor IF-2 N-terminal domain-containing protein [Nocardia bovistercoris]
MPERIRVHALAKRLGVTSKRILAKLTELGADARSAQSNVDRAVAESVRDALDTAEGAEPAAGDVAAASASTRAAEVAAPVDTGAAHSGASEAVRGGGSEVAHGGDAGAAHGGTEAARRGADAFAVETTESVDAESAVETRADAPGSRAGLLFSAPEVAQPGGTGSVAAAQQPLRLFTHAERTDDVAVAPVVFESAAVSAPLFLPPDAAAIEETRKQRRAEREARRVEEPPVEVEDESDTGDDDTDDGGADQSGDADGQPRRRRRGRRGRGRGRGEQHSDADGDEDHTDAAESSDADDVDDSEDVAAESVDGADDTDGEDGDGLPEGSSRRRRRRRRRKVAGEGEGAETAAEDDPPNTVVHEREPRNKSRGRAANADEVQGITGSTRLEAKRQRRRDGREAGRRRPPILTESEFLARRESVDRVMVVREKTFQDHPTATQVAVLEDNILVEHFVTSTGSASMVGNVYLGRVQNVLPSMEAAFVDIGRGRNGVLYAGEVNWEAAGLGGRERKIEQALKPGDQVLVQVSKDPVGHKGARLTTQISLAGRFLVYVPGGTSTGISRKLPDTERKRLKEILRDIVPADAGVIIRTASEGVAEAELARDVERLQATWRTIEEQAAKENGAPKTLYEEPDLLVKVIRDLFNEDFSRLVIEGERAWSTVERYIGTVAPDLLARVSRHDAGSVDVFETYRIDEQLAKALDRKVWLPSGGTLVIDRTEAMTVIDVNTGKFTGSGGSNLEETVTRNNLEAAEEIVRQMRLRDIGGMIVVDFIDMVLESNRDLVLRRLTEALGRDRTRHQVSEVTSLGLVQMTRKKLGTGLVEAFSTTCEHCHGRGILVHTYPVEPSASEDGGARKETGSRRRRGRDKGAAPTPPAVATAPVPEVSEEDAAVKRAHPVALAMAAHQHSDDDVDESDLDTGDIAEAGEAEAAHAEVGAAASGAESGSAAGDAEVVVTGSTTVAEAVVAAEDAVIAEFAANALSAGAEAVVVRDGVSAEVGAEQSVAVVSEVRTVDTAAETPVGRAAKATRGDRRKTAETRRSKSAAADRAETAVARRAETAVAHGAETAVAHGAETAVARGAETPVARGAETPVARDSDTTTARGLETATENGSGATHPATSGTNGAPEPGRPARRRRVARSAAAPAADSGGAVFVVSGNDQPSAPVLDPDEPVPTELLARKPRRRAVGRPAGPPVDD